MLSRSLFSSSACNVTPRGPLRLLPVPAKGWNSGLGAPSRTTSLPRTVLSTPGLCLPSAVSLSLPKPPLLSPYQNMGWSRLRKSCQREKYGCQWELLAVYSWSKASRSGTQPDWLCRDSWATEPDRMEKTVIVLCFRTKTLYDKPPCLFSAWRQGLSFYSGLSWLCPELNQDQKRLLWSYR